MVPNDSPARSPRDLMLAGELYIANDPELAADSRRALKLMERFNLSSVDEPELRRQLLGELLSGFGEGAVVTRSLPANVVAVGNPARVVRTLEKA